MYKPTVNYVKNIVCGDTMSKQILRKLALERCGFYLSQLLAHIHLSGMDGQDGDIHAPQSCEDDCLYTLITAMQSDLAVLEELIEE